MPTNKFCIILVLAFAFLAVPVGAKPNTGNQSVDQLIQDLKNENGTIRANAADALGRLNDTRAVEPLIQALKD